MGSIETDHVISEPCYSEVIYYNQFGSHEMAVLYRKLDPVVQSIVSLTISLRHKFVKQISAKVTNTLLFFVEKM